MLIQCDYILLYIGDPFSERYQKIGNSSYVIEWYRMP